MRIRRYTKEDQDELFGIIVEEGEEWQCYYGEDNIEQYKKALENSITYVAFKENVLCGYIRCRDDDGFGIYVYDVLVRKAYRRHHFGRKLMEKVCSDYQKDTVYVMSGVDEYYQKLGYVKEGSIFIVHKQSLKGNSTI